VVYIKVKRTSRKVGEEIIRAGERGLGVGGLVIRGLGEEGLGVGSVGLEGRRLEGWKVAGAASVRRSLRPRSGRAFVAHRTGSRRS
jgi:hypothetical protein